MIKENVQRILSQLPKGVELVAAAKERSPEEVRAAIEAGVRIIGENHVGETRRVYRVLEQGAEVKWHFIGIPERAKHDLLRPSTLTIFDMIETVASVEIAAGISKTCAKIGKEMPVLIEINSGREKQKAGVLPEDAEQLIREISALSLSHLKIVGLMTIGSVPYQKIAKGSEEEERVRTCFETTKGLFDLLQELNLENVEMRYLSMGMTSTYQLAIQEGANIVRVGTAIFGKRKEK